MASRTTNLNLILPSHDEYFNTWDVPVNANFVAIDSAIGSLNTEVLEARGSEASLNDRLSVSMNPDGTLLPTAEVEAARSSTVYGAFNGSTAYSLNDRVEQGDRESFYARQSLSDLTAGLAYGADDGQHNCVQSAANNFLTYTGAVVSLNGSVTPCVANINGYRQVVRTIKTTTISGAAGTYYLSLTKGSYTYVTEVASGGSIGTYAANGLVAKLQDNTKNFVTLGVKPGDVLEITAPGGNPNLGKYIVLATNVEDNTNLTTSELAIQGQFVSASTGLNYTITDPISPTFGFTGTAHAKTFTRVANTIYIGRCVFDGANVTSLTIYQTQGLYSGFTSITLGGGLYNVTIPHNLGYMPKRVHIYASQASDFTQPLEPLSVADISGGGSLQRSCIAQMTDLILQVKNSTSGLFYKDFSGVAQTSGYLYVVVER